MKKETFLKWVTLLIILAPLPFGCVGRLWRPLFFLTLLVISLLAMRYQQEPPRLRNGWMIGFLSLGVLAFMLMQLLPLPVSLVKLLSPGALQYLDRFAPASGAFHSLSLVPGATLRAFTELAVLFIFFYVLAGLRLRRHHVIGLVDAMIFSACLQTVIGLLRMLSGNQRFFIFFYPLDSPIETMTGTLAVPNHFSFILELTVPLIVTLIFMRWVKRSSGDPAFRLTTLLRDRRMVAYVIAMGIVALGIYFSKSFSGRTIVVMTLVLQAAGLIYIHLRRPELIRAGLRWFFLVFFVFVLLFAWQNTQEKVGRPDRYGYVRVDFWATGMEIFKGFPLIGAGMGVFKHVSFTQADTGLGQLNHAHNEIVEILADGGILGTGLVIWLAGLIFLSLFRMWHGRHNLEVRTLGLAVLVSMVAAVFHSLFDFALRVPFNGFLMVTLVAVVVQTMVRRSGGESEGS